MFDRGYMAEVCVYVYPWDVAEIGPAAMVEWATVNGVDRLAVAAAYHSAELINPRSTGRVHMAAEPNVSHLHLPAADFNQPLALPPGSLAATHPGMFGELADRARQAGIGVTAWTVMLHNSDLARSVPSAALQNCFGDRSVHGLCPANTDVREYAVQLVTGVARTELFDELMLESLSYLVAPHGHPHELWSVRMDIASRALLSLCFCEHCVRRGELAGMDGERLRAWVADTLRRGWNAPTQRLRGSDDGLDLLGLIFARPDLHDWVQMRCEAVSSLFAQVSEAAGSRVRVSAGGPVWARPLPLGVVEGIDLTADPQPARTMLMPYYTALDDVVRDLEFALNVSVPDRFQIIQSLWQIHHPGGVGDLLGKIDAARALEFDQFGLYNFASATAPALTWVRAVSDRVHS